MSTNKKLKKDFVYHEISTDSDNIVKDIARLLAMGIESEEIRDEFGVVVKPASPIKEKCWEVIYPVEDKTAFPEVEDWNNLLPEEYAAITQHKINKITDKVILKTTTIPKDIKDKNASTSIGVNKDLSVDRISMYLELYMPPYLCDSETEDPLLQKTGYIPKVNDIKSVSTLIQGPYQVQPTRIARNYHHLFMRIFDNLNDTKDGPAENVIDNTTRDVIKWNSRSSEWCKLSWYTDFEDLFISDLIGKPEEGDRRGVLRSPVIYSGLTSETKIKIWANINRSRVVLGVMGSPNVDFSDNKYLMSCSYIGQIDSFDFSVNDTVGNFGIFTTSSSSPAIRQAVIKTRKTEPYPKGSVTPSRQTIATIPSTIMNPSEYEIEYEIPSISSIPFDAKYVDGGPDWGDRYVALDTIKVFYRTRSANIITLDNGPWSNSTIADNIEIPCEISLVDGERSKVKLKIKYKDVIEKTYGSLKDSALNSTQITLENRYWSNRSWNYINATTALELEFSYYTEYQDATGGVIRNKMGGVVKEIYPTTYGKNTANGMRDFAMYATYSKDYFQRHELAFVSTEEFMDKELYGKSVYTGEYLADRIKVIHPSEGPRGLLNGMITIDTSSLNPFNDLIINEGFAKYKDQPEELYKYFPITAPTCPFSSSPNGRHGIGILKDIRYPIPVTDEEIVDFALYEIERKYMDLDTVIEDFVLIDKSEHGAKITWESSDPLAIEVEDPSLGV